ncbi:WYL domain-containing protein [Paenibacillus sp. CGMCC 1.16610]|uniref:WYL domain-containing protein n=1 Tax=Paenibacillus anseongense TaxID=2682845 RepID=A0ABW9UD51_9BACL|nr:MULTISPECIES: WYL domain-containing protein [Paenibacillus]MBA2944159.1 WYL domain-containing protein [Paenibacillus sp. CGMCC 1.16610]MVQ38049.1 WYL domain-containing protein [Paenibacillus anseongense]
MNLFEKIFNYDMVTKLENAGTFMVTSVERSWLKTMLNHPAALHAFTPAAMEKLQRVLDAEPALDLSEAFMEKARSKEKQVFHPQLRILRRVITRQGAIRLTYRVKDERIFVNEMAFPYKLEYSQVKKDWYLLWYHLRHRAIMSTKLDNIEAVHDLPFSAERAAQVQIQIEKLLHKRHIQATITVVKIYNRELSRILYAFSCFEKQVDYDEKEGTYTIQLIYLNNEAEYVLSKLRFLGKRVRVVRGEYLQKRMLESAQKALARYEAPVGVEPAEGAAGGGL